MEVIDFEIKGLLLFKPKVYNDSRGYFFESFSQKVFNSHVDGEIIFVQDNQSLSHKNAVRGLHFQAPPHAQGKLVSVVQGAVVDLVVDIRKSSPTFGQGLEVALCADEMTFLWIPPGFAHGFYTTENHTIFQYKCTNYYHQKSEGSIQWADPMFGFEDKVKDPIISPKDLVAPLFNDIISPF